MDGAFFLAGATGLEPATSPSYTRDALTNCSMQSRFFLLFNCRSLFMASDRAEYSSLYTKLHGILALVYRLRPSLCRRNLSAKHAV